MRSPRSDLPAKSLLDHSAAILVLAQALSVTATSARSRRCAADAAWEGSSFYGCLKYLWRRIPPGPSPCFRASG